MTLLAALLLAQAPPVKVCDPTVSSKCVTTTTSASKQLLDVAVQNAVSTGDGGFGTTYVVGTMSVYVLDGGPPFNVQGTFFQATQPVSIAATVSENIAQVNGQTVNVGTGAAGTGTQRVAVSSDSALTCNAGTNLNTSALALDATLTNRTQKAVVTDGTRDVTVKAASTAAGATDTALVVAVSPNNSVAVTQATGTNLHAVLDTTSTTAVTQATGTNLHAVLDTTSTTACTQATGTNLHVVTDATSVLAANQSVNVAQLAGTTTDTNSGLKSAGTLRVVLATDQPALTNKLLVTPDSVALPANQSVNAAQFGGTNVSTGTGVGGAGIPRVTISSDSSLAANQSTNVAQVNGVTTQTGIGASGTGTLRVAAIVHDGTTGAGVIVATTALKTDLSSVAGTATVTAAAGVQKVGVVGNAGAVFDGVSTAAAAPANMVAIGAVNRTALPTLTDGQSAGLQCSTKGILFSQLHDGTTAVGVIAGTTALKTDMSSIAGTATGTAAAGVQKVGIVGNANAAIDAANNAAAPANVLAIGVETATQTSTQPTAATAGNVRRAVASTDGVLFVKSGGPVQWQCSLGAVGTTLTQCQAAPGAGLRLYITDILAVSGTTTSGLWTLRQGTGSNCVTGTANVFFASAAATIPNAPNNAVGGPNAGMLQFTTPIAITAATALCVLGVVTNTTNITISGYTAP